VIPAPVEKGSEEEAFPVGDFPGVDSIPLQSATEENAVDDFNGPKEDDDPGVVGETLGKS